MSLSTLLRIGLQAWTLIAWLREFVWLGISVVIESVVDLTTGPLDNHCPDCQDCSLGLPADVGQINIPQGP